MRMSSTENHQFSSSDGAKGFSVAFVGARYLGVVMVTQWRVFRITRIVALRLTFEASYFEYNYFYYYKIQCLLIICS